MEIKKTIGIRLNLLIEQENELKQLFSAFCTGINWSLVEIEKRYQRFLLGFKPMDERVNGICAECEQEKQLQYTHENKCYCAACAMKNYSEYTVRKEIYGTGERAVENDLKNVVNIPNKTHYTMLFAQAYGMWKSFNAWRNKRAYQADQAKKDLDAMTVELRHIISEIELNANHIKSNNKNLTWLHANAQAFKIVYSIHPGIDTDIIKKSYEKYRDFKRLSKPLTLPKIDECRTIMMNSGFVNWDGENLYMTLWGKKEKVNFWGKEYLSQYIPKMEEDNKVYCNITKKKGQYYLMYPLAIPVMNSPDVNECDPFVVVFSPNKIGILGYDKCGCLNSAKWINTGQVLFAKRHFKEKRAEILARQDKKDGLRKGLKGEELKKHREKMRKIRKRRKRLSKRGDREMRYVSSEVHQLTHQAIEYIAETSENPKVLIWDIGNGITQNFGKQLNYLKNLWPAVKEQEYLKHKAMQISIPVIEIKYNKVNDLICSSCGKKQANGKKPAKVITQLIKGIKNFKCENCGYEVNMLINQGNNIMNLDAEM